MPQMPVEPIGVPKSLGDPCVTQARLRRQCLVDQSERQSLRKVQCSKQSDFASGQSGFVATKNAADDHLQAPNPPLAVDLGVLVFVIA
jgi:hypothetical protein